MPTIIDTLKEIIRGKGVAVVFPESEDARILEAAEQLGAEGLLKPILLGDSQTLKEKAPHCIIIDPEQYEAFEDMVEAFLTRRAGKATREEALKLLKTPNYFGTMLVYMGLAQGLVSGAIHSTGDTVRPALQIIKTKPGISKTFGYFLMIREEEKYIMADCAINPDPTAEDLAEFAVESAKAAAMFGLDPKVAMLSFSTNGSADTPSTQKMAEATRLAKAKNSGFAIDGEMQFDAAFVESVGASKFKGSSVAGKANTFIFPDLDAGNIGYKITQRLGNFEAVGPILAGLNKPVNDLSRGCSVLDVYNTAIITAAQSLDV
ncbi:MAG: phosphate acetyltransferase [Acholeplasmatales bacterium]|nr:MAG: phosphate acetyltransferase [Acholeplasmatales bacterium]